MSEEETKDYTKNSQRNIIILISIIILIAAAFLIYQNSKNNVDPVDELNERIMKGDAYFFNGFLFEKNNDMWYTTVLRSSDKKSVKIPLHYGPNDVYDIKLSGSLNSNFTKKKFYVTVEPNSQTALALSELLLNLKQGMNVYPEIAYTYNDTSIEHYFPTITCDNTNETVIYLKPSKETKVTYDDNCIIIEGTNETIIKSTDFLILRWYGIIN